MCVQSRMKMMLGEHLSKRNRYAQVGCQEGYLRS